MPSLPSLLEATADAGLEALVEVHTAGEARRAVAAGARIIGVNNRDLATFDVDLATAETLAAAVAAAPVRVAESGILEACRRGPNGRGRLPGRAGGRGARESGRSGGAAPRAVGCAIMTWVKVCGLSRPEEVEAAVAAGADAIGFVFYEPSPRHVAPALARSLGASAGVLTVAVTVDLDADSLLHLADLAGVGAVQPHGEHAAALRRRRGRSGPGRAAAGAGGRSGRPERHLRRRAPAARQRYDRWDRQGV